MTDYDPNNRGAIWPNKNKQEDWHSDFEGNAMIEGQEFYVNAWKKKPDAKENAPSLNFQFKPKIPKSDAVSDSRPNELGPKPTPNDEIPF